MFTPFCFLYTATPGITLPWPIFSRSKKELLQCDRIIKAGNPITLESSLANQLNKADAV